MRKRRSAALSRPFTLRLIPLLILAILCLTLPVARNVVAPTPAVVSHATDKQHLHDVRLADRSRRVYSTKKLEEEGYSRHHNFLWPPGFGNPKLALLDVGANAGDVYTLQGYRAGHDVIAFEPSASLHTRFRRTMSENRVSMSVADVTESTHTGPADHVSYRVTDNSTASHHHVLLVPFGLSNTTGTVHFLEKSECGETGACGKTNRIIDADSPRARAMRAFVHEVRTFRLDDLELPSAVADRVWFVKIDVEGFEAHVVRGAARFLARPGVRYVAVEFSPNGRTGSHWGVDLLDALLTYGFVCYHVRGFGKCHDSTVRSPSARCNFPFAHGDNPHQPAPTFEQYSRVFEITDDVLARSPRMSDLMCRKEY